MLKRKILYLAALVCVFIVNILFVEYEPFNLLVILILFPIVLNVLLKIQNNNLGIILSLQNEVVSQGETIEINARIDNSFVLPISKIKLKFKIRYFNCKDDVIHTFDFGVRGNSILEFDKNLTLNYCGKVYFYIEEATIYDYLSFNKKKRKCDFTSTLIVMPKLYEQTHNKERVYNAYLSESDEYSQDKPGDDPSEVFDLREYADGDNLSRVHWKLSSKGEGLIVKEYSCPMVKTEVILVELLESLSKGGRKNIDSIYQAVYALGNYFLHNGVVFVLAFYNKSASSLKSVTIDNLENLQLAIKNIIEMNLYDMPYAWNNFWLSDISNNSRIHYIRYIDLEKTEYVNAKVGKNGEYVGENNIILVDENNIQEIVDLFYLKV